MKQRNKKELKEREGKLERDKVKKRNPELQDR